MDDKLGIFKTMVLNMSMGSKMTEKQIEYILSWAKRNISPMNFDKLAEIAWQYDAEELKDKLNELHREYLSSDS